MKYYLGLDIGGTKIMFMLADENGNIVHRLKAPTTGDISLIEKSIRDLIASAGIAESDICAMALGVPGTVEGGCTVLDAPALGWHNLALSELFERFPFKCIAANDVTCALWAECEYGWGKNSDNIIFISIGTGLGSAIKADGRIIEGFRGMSGEIGYFVGIEQVSDRLAGFGSQEYGALESIVSGTGLTNSGRPFGLTAASIFEAREKGDPNAVRIIDEFICANCASLLNPEYIVLGGGISNELEPFMERIRDSVSRLTPISTKIEITKLKSEAGGIGTVTLARSI